MQIIKYGVEVPNKLVQELSVDYETNIFDNPYSIVEMINKIFRLNKKAEEYVYMLSFNTKGKLLGVFEITHGTVNYSVISPREIFLRALLCGASNIILIHNHPSGDVHPSDIDITITKTIRKLGKTLYIPLLDHIIVGNEDFYSISDKNLYIPM